MAERAFLDDPSAILDSIVDCVIVIDHDYVINGINQAAEVFFGISASSLLGQSALELVAEGDRVETTVRFKEIIEGHQSPPLVFRIIDASGRYRWVEATGNQLSPRHKRPFERASSPTAGDSGAKPQVVVTLRSVGTRLKRELEGLQAVRRAYFISRLAAQLQTSTPTTFSRVLSKAFEEIGSLLGAHLISVFEVEASGRNLMLRCRWKDHLSELHSRAAPQARVAVEEIPNVVKALTGPELLQGFTTDSRLGAELQNVDAAISNGVVVPLNLSRDYVGVLLVSWREQREIRNDESQFLLDLAEVVAVALNRIVTSQALISQNLLLERIFERTRVPMVIVSCAELKVTRANSAATELFSVGSKQLDGSTIAQVSTELAQELNEFSTLPEHVEYRDLRLVMNSNQNGRAIELELSIDRMTMMELPCYLIVVRNSTSVT